MAHLLDWLFDYTNTMTFDFSGTTEAAISQLARASAKPILRASTASENGQPLLVGTVTKDLVRLHKLRFFYGNIFKPIFYGKFSARNEKPILTGLFTMGQ